MSYIIYVLEKKLFSEVGEGEREENFGKRKGKKTGGVEKEKKNNWEKEKTDGNWMRVWGVEME